MGSPAIWAFALVLTCGCNQVLGLDAPERENADARDHDAIAVDAAGDRDMDGVLDGDDDCPDAPDPQQFDEDGDGRGDRCDLCPYLNQSDDVDGDEDNIPDACDPYPMRGGGRLRFNGFHTAEEMNDWRTIGAGTVAWDGTDSARMMPALDGELRIQRTDNANMQTLTRVIAELELETPPAGTVARRAIGLVIDVNTAQTDGWLCQIETDLPVTDVRLAMYRFEGGGTTLLLAPSIGSTYPLGRLQMEFDVGRDGDEQTPFGARCQTTGAGGSHLLARTGAPPLSPGEAGVRTYGIPVRVNWIAIVDHP